MGCQQSVPRPLLTLSRRRRSNNVASLDKTSSKDDRVVGAIDNSPSHNSTPVTLYREINSARADSAVGLSRLKEHSKKTIENFCPCCCCFGFCWGYLLVALVGVLFCSISFCTVSLALSSPYSFSCSSSTM